MSCLLLLIALFGFGLFGFQQAVPAPVLNVTPVETSVTLNPAYHDDTGVVVSRFAVARDLDADGCPVGETTTFRRSEAVSVFAIGAFPRGTTVFARMYYDGFPVEDTDTLTADRNYDDVCLYFIFEPTLGAEVFDRGPYSVEFIIGNIAAGSVDFVIE